MSANVELPVYPARAGGMRVYLGISVKNGLSRSEQSTRWEGAKGIVRAFTGNPQAREPVASETEPHALHDLAACEIAYGGVNIDC